MKSALTSAKVLTHYDPDQELILDCDASPYGIGAVLSHRFLDGQIKPVAFTSRSFTSAEKRYSQLDKEALAIVFGVKKFNQYLAGRVFTIYSDHKPLQHIFAEGKPVPTMASARIQRWALSLSAYRGKMFLVVVDAHSKWLEIEIVPSATSSNTIAKLRAMFATHGICCCVR